MIVFISNYFNHHQKPFSDEMYRLTNGNFKFITTANMPEFRKQLGYKEENASYVVNYNDNKTYIEQLLLSADVVLFSANKLQYVKKRIRQGKITINISERRYKQFKNFLKLPIHILRSPYYNKCYLLCASAYAASDYHMTFMPYQNCFKWGYFTKVDDRNIDVLLNSKKSSKMRLMWCARFISWKHPEMVLQLASRLKQTGFDFEINMYGNGPLLDLIKKEVKDNNLDEFVFLRGNASNEEIISAMQQHHIFLFTSDRNEGWGAVANEAMSNGCTLVGSDKTGSVPYLLQKDNYGLVFKSENLDSLFKQVERLIKDPLLCENIARNAYYLMKNMWSPENAAIRLIKLIENLQKGNSSPFSEGPCSNAIPV